MKIGNPCYGQVRNSSSLHGSQQSFMAVDIYGSERPLEFRAVADGKIGGRFDAGSIYEGFHLYCDCGLDVIYVHCKWYGDVRVKRGDKITISAWSHDHTSARFAGIWDAIWSYTDPNEVTYTSEGPAFIVYPYPTLPKYRNLDASTGKLIINNKSMRITGQFKIKLNGGIWNIRSQPTTAGGTAPSLGKTPPNEEFNSTEIEVYGEIANGTTLWAKYKDNVNWISGAAMVSCVAISGDAQCPIDLAKCNSDKEVLNQQVTSLTNENSALKTTSELEKFKNAKFNKATGVIFNPSDL
jgi:hypothetical protein